MGSSAETSLESLLDTLSRDGKDFERLCKWFLQNDPESRAEYGEVWLWDEWPGRWGRDRGIDLVAQTHDGRTVAVQAKQYAPRHSITKRDIDTFLSESNRAVIHARLLIGTTNRVARSANEVMENQEKPVSTCLLARLRASPVPWPANVVGLAPVTVPRVAPRPHQVRALEAIAAWAQSPLPRGQVVMACGTGKSLVAIWTADRLSANRVLVLVPTNALLRQTTREWCTQSSTSRRLLQICSDTARNHTEVEELFRGDELGVTRTTEPHVIAERLRQHGPLLVLCTYDSSPVLADAMRMVPERRFDLAIADEAHRCAGLETSSHKTILDDEVIRAERRMFFTATPTVFGTRDKARAKLQNVRLASMDDRSVFGPVIHHLSFAEAITQRLLTPYRVAVIPITDDDVHEFIRRRRIVTADGDHNLEAAALATQIACARAMRRFECRRIVAFHRGVTESQRFSEHFRVAATLLHEDERPAGGIWSEHVDGRFMPYPKRTRLIEHFASEVQNGEARILSNVRLLAEGVNVPGIDGIAFIDTQRGQTAVIQAVGRAVRNSPGKEFGTIILPVFLRDGESIDAALARSDHRHIVDVLGALRSHDPDILKSLDAIRYSSADEAAGASAGQFVIDAPVDVGREFADAVELALANALGATRPRAPRESQQLQAVTILEPTQPPTDEELFQIGLMELSIRGRWRLLPTIPEVSGFPMRDWWGEFMRRWNARNLDPGDLDTVADALSWLAPELEHIPSLRRELCDRAIADVPEQVASQLSTGGALCRGELGALAEMDADELVEPMRALQRSLAHAATSPGYQVRRIELALKLVARAIDLTLERLEPQPWQMANVRRAVLYGFVHELASASTRVSDDQPPPDWTARSHKRADRAGRDAAKPLLALARRIRIFRFAEDDQVVVERRFDELDLAPDARLDAIGWDIFLLSLARQLSPREAASQAMGGTLAERQRVRRDLIRRSLRHEGVEDPWASSDRLPTASRAAGSHKRRQ